jgi:methionyl-tRNA formyltransferase
MIHTNGTSLNLKIFNSAPVNIQKSGMPGTIESDGKRTLKVQTSIGMIDVLLLQVEGKKRLSTEEFLRGFHGIEQFKFC